jgi:hypothetical protein
MTTHSTVHYNHCDKYPIVAISVTTHSTLHYNHYYMFTKLYVTPADIAFTTHCAILLQVITITNAHIPMSCICDIVVSCLLISILIH